MSFIIPIYERTYYPRRLACLERLFTLPKGRKLCVLTIKSVSKKEDLLDCVISEIDPTFRSFDQICHDLNTANRTRQTTILVQKKRRMATITGKENKVLRVFSRTMPTVDIHRNSLKQLDAALIKLDQTKSIKQHSPSTL